MVNCSKFLNRSIKVIPVTAHDLLAYNRSRGGAAGRDKNGRAIILYDRVLESNPVALNHIVAHECAHHAYGLVATSADSRTTEYDADCLASKILVKQLGYGKAEFATITDFLMKFSYIGRKRAANVLECANLR